MTEQVMYSAKKTKFKKIQKKKKNLKPKDCMLSVQL